MKLQRKRLIGRRARQALRSVAVLLISGLMLAGCGVGRAMVIKPPDEQLRVVFVQVKEGNSPVAVPPEVKADFMNKLNHYLHGEDGFQRGPELTINYRFIQYEPGSQFTRWFWGGIGNAGEASLTVEAKYFNPANKEVATINAEGRIGSGFFGGALSEAVDKAAEKIAEYTKTNFR
ncbi:MAG TPA: hypothetical protein VIH18_10470 [Candidatus Binatia bacterium]|jgi:hypothetical protein